MLPASTLTYIEIDKVIVIKEQMHRCIPKFNPNFLNKKIVRIFLSLDYFFIDKVIVIKEQMHRCIPKLDPNFLNKKIVRIFLSLGYFFTPN